MECGNLECLSVERKILWIVRKCILVFSTELKYLTVPDGAELLVLV